MSLPGALEWSGFAGIEISWGFDGVAAVPWSLRERESSPLAQRGRIVWTCRRWLGSSSSSEVFLRFGGRASVRSWREKRPSSSREMRMARLSGRRHVVIRWCLGDDGAVLRRGHIRQPLEESHHAPYGRVIMT